MRIFLLVSVSILFVGCCQERMTAARTGCLPEELDFPDGKHWITPTHWEALCHGKRYACKLTDTKSFLIFWGWQDAECIPISTQ